MMNGRRDSKRYIQAVGTCPDISIHLLAAVALLAGLIPAWRAARLDPMEAIREQ